jgi:hypothetical protein
MHWKDYRLTRTRVATGDAGDGARRVLELFDGRHLVEREGAPAEIFSGSFEEAKERATALVRTAPKPRTWWHRIWFWVFGGRS